MEQAHVGLFDTDIFRIQNEVKIPGELQIIEFVSQASIGIGDHSEKVASVPQLGKNGPDLRFPPAPQPFRIRLLSSEELLDDLRMLFFGGSDPIQQDCEISPPYCGGVHGGHPAREPSLVLYERQELSVDCKTRLVLRVADRSTGHAAIEF